MNSRVGGARGWGNFITLIYGYAGVRQREGYGRVLELALHTVHTLLSTAYTPGVALRRCTVAQPSPHPTYATRSHPCNMSFLPIRRMLRYVGGLGG